MLPEQVWNPETTFIDIACVDGSKLQAVYTMLDKKLSEIPEYKDTYRRREHIVQNQLYGICLNSNNAFLISRKIFGDPFSQNLVQIDNYESLLLNSRFSNIQSMIRQNTNIEKFDVVLGQTPIVSSKDIYIDYVNFGNYIQKEYCLAVTPGKWSLKRSGRNIDKHLDFLKNQSLKIQKVLYYCKKTLSIIDTNDCSGITFILFQNQSDNDDTLIKFSMPIKYACTDWEIHLEKPVKLIPDRVLNISEKAILIDNQRFLDDFDDWMQQKQYVDGFKQKTQSEQQYIKVKRGDTVQGYVSERELNRKIHIKQWKLIISYVAQYRYITNKYMYGPIKGYACGPDEVPGPNFMAIKYFKTEEECKSAVSFFNQALVGLLLYYGFYNRTTQTEEFNLLPNPNDWSVTYVDSPHPNTTTDEKGYYTYNGERYCSLYVRYKLSKEDIDIIESIIKARK